MTHGRANLRAHALKALPLAELQRVLRRGHALVVPGDIPVRVGRDGRNEWLGEGRAGRVHERSISRGEGGRGMAVAGGVQRQQSRASILW
jgi:hypothetical protein